jgi:hypothetical protein
MVEFPRGAQKPFKDRAGRDANNRADAKFRGIVVGTLRGHERSRLTVKLRGRTTTPDKRRGRTLSPGARGARGAKPQAHHGPLQRLLGRTSEP